MPVQECHQRDHVVAVAMTVAFQRRKQSIEFVLVKRLALAAVGLTLFDFPLYSLISRLEVMHRHWLSRLFQHSTFYIVI